MVKSVKNQEKSGSGFAERLLSVIMDKYKSVRSFAIENNLSPSVVAQYVNGKSEPTRPVLCLMAKALEIRVDWLATGEGVKSDPAMFLSMPLTQANCGLKAGLPESDEIVRMTSPSSSGVDKRELLIQCMEIVDKHQDLSRRKRAEILFLISDKALKEGRVDVSFAEALLSLAGN